MMKARDSNSSTPILSVDKSRVLAGAEWNLCISTRYLNKAKYRSVIAADFPLPHHALYRQYGAEVRHRAAKVQWWMGSDRWKHPLRGTDAAKRMIFAWRLRQIIRESGALILNVSLLSRDSWVDLAAARFMGVRTVGNVNSLLSQRPLDQKTLELCDILICGSDVVAREIGGLTEPSKIIRIYSPISISADIGIDEQHNAKIELVHSPSAVIISSVAMLDARKGHDVAIQAFTKFSADYRNAILLIVGGAYSESGTTEMERLKKIAMDAGVGSHVIFTGYMPDLRKVYAASDIVLALSKDGEAFGRVTAEAAAHGRVAIGTAVGAAPEIMRDGVTGFLVPPDDADAVAACCRRILADERLVREMATAAKDHAMRNYNPETITRQIESVYDRLLMS